MADYMVWNSFFFILLLFLANRYHLLFCVRSRCTWISKIKFEIVCMWNTPNNREHIAIAKIHAIRANTHMLTNGTDYTMALYGFKHVSVNFYQRINVFSTWWCRCFTPKQYDINFESKRSQCENKMKMYRTVNVAPAAVWSCARSANMANDRGG